MQAAKLYIALILTLVLAAVAPAQSQRNNAQTGAAPVTDQNANPQPSNSGKSTATSDLPADTNKSGQAAPRTSQREPSPGIATPANPPASGVNSPVMAAPSEPQSGISQSTLFELFFNNLSVLNDVADKDDKAGDHIMAVAWRTHDQRAAGLNDAEGQIVREITLDCVRLLKEKDAKIRALAERDRAQPSPGTVIPASPEMIQTFEERKKVISDHIETLREALGDASFNKLDTYVHSSLHAEVIAPKPAAPSTNIIEKNQKESK